MMLRLWMTHVVAVASVLLPWRTSQESAPPPESPVQDEPGELCAEAAALAERGELGQALDKYSEALALDLDSVPARLGRAFVHEQLGEFEEALEDLGHVLARDPRDGEALFARGRVHNQLGNLAKSLADLERALELDLCLQLPLRAPAAPSPDPGGFPALQPC